MNRARVYSILSLTSDIDWKIRSLLCVRIVRFHSEQTIIIYTEDTFWHAPVFFLLLLLQRRLFRVIYLIQEEVAATLNDGIRVASKALKKCVVFFLLLLLLVSVLLRNFKWPRWAGIYGCRQTKYQWLCRPGLSALIIISFLIWINSLWLLFEATNVCYICLSFWVYSRINQLHWSHCE